MLPATETELPSSAGHTIRLLTWAPDARPTHVIQILHGLGEYADRYARFAAAATQAGMAVACHDHRGHGPKSEHLGFFADGDGWHQIFEDARVVNERLRDQYPDTPLVLLGHSMGSFLAQQFAMHFGGELNGLVLSASTWPSRIQLFCAKGIAAIEALRVGKTGHSALLHALGFSRFNSKFKPARTELDWLSRDEEEVDRYIADPCCGGPYSAQLWRDVTQGLLNISTDNALMRIPADLPILLTAGTDDPIGGDRGIGNLALHYAQTGHQRLKVKLYDGGRHELLNDTCRDQTTADWLEWIRAVPG
ncbi:MAG: alpha/beta fold hydrolase [Pseudomonadota bacterium]